MENEFFKHLPLVTHCHVENLLLVRFHPTHAQFCANKNYFTSYIQKPIFKAFGDFFLAREIIFFNSYIVKMIQDLFVKKMGGRKL
jgi:hypothetical protein